MYSITEILISPSDSADTPYKECKTNTFQFYIIVYSSIQKRCTHFNAGSYLIPITIKEAYRGSDK